LRALLLPDGSSFPNLAFFVAEAAGAGSADIGCVSIFAVLLTFFRALIEDWFGSCAALGAAVASLLRLRFRWVTGGKEGKSKDSRVLE
jgi:hypothetical protein